LSAEISAPDVTDVNVPPEIRSSVTDEATNAAANVTDPVVVITPVPTEPENDGAVTTPVAVVIVTSPGAAFAAGIAITDRNPAVRADAATAAMRFLSVLLDILSLSLSQIRPFLIWLEEVI